MKRDGLAALALIAGVLTITAAMSPVPNRVTDRATYEAVARHLIVDDCSDLQCFRVLVPWTLHFVPGPSVVKWRAYAVLCNCAAAAAVFALCLTFGLGGRVAVFSAVVSAVGFGSMYTLHDPYTSDPLMFVVGPLITRLLWADRAALGAVVGAVAVLAKEFAAAPAYAFALFAAVHRRWVPALRSLAAGNTAFLVWLALTLLLMLRFDYSYGFNGEGSADFAHGAALALWARDLTARGIAAAMFNEFGALWVLAPIGVLFAPRPLRSLAAVSLPIAAIFCYVQQPDRALWNFHYLVSPLAALVLVRVPPLVAWSIVAAFGVGNLRVAAQLPLPTTAHIAIGASVILAATSGAVALRHLDHDAVLRHAESAPAR